MARLKDVVKFCDELTHSPEFKDYPGAYNGLQIENSGEITRIGASVDAGLESFEQAIGKGIDFLIVHHGPFWEPAIPLTGIRYRKFLTALQGSLAVYGSHLPLDAHPEIGNNVLLAREIGLIPSGQFGFYEGQPIGWYADTDYSRTELESRLKNRFPNMTALNHGTDTPKRVGIITGGGASSLPELAADGIDTLITGECSQHHFNQSQELGINLYLCGHYATEVFGVQALAKKIADHFGLDWEFIDTGCPI
jgi:dinuclear metal center YbgI/SA1388 family protein